MGLIDFRQWLMEYYSLLLEVQEDVLEGKENNDYDDFIDELEIYTHLHSNSPYRREHGLQQREKKLMRQEDIPVKKGGKTRKNRKPRK